jgi:hypothetical protein
MPPIDESLSEIRSVRNEIWRCRQLLRSRLSDDERAGIEQRLYGQQAIFEALLKSTFPLVLELGSRT